MRATAHGAAMQQVSGPAQRAEAGRARDGGRPRFHCMIQILNRSRMIRSNSRIRFKEMAFYLRALSPQITITDDICR